MKELLRLYTGTITLEDDIIMKQKILFAFLVYLMLFGLSGCIMIKNNNPNDTNYDLEDSSLVDNTTTIESTDIFVFERKPDIYKEYSDMLSHFENIINVSITEPYEYALENGFLDYPDSELSYNWSCMIIEAMYATAKAEPTMFGYILQDINSDEIEELFIVRENNTILASFTLYEEKIYLLDAYWSKHKCIVSENLNLLVKDSIGAEAEYKVQKLEKNSINLTTIKEFGMDYVQNDGILLEYYCFESLNGDRVPITEGRLLELKSEYPFENIWDKKQRDGSITKTVDGTMSSDSDS